MSYQSMLIHECDIHHLKTTPGETKFGVPGEPSQGYIEVPDLLSVRCFFSKQGMAGRAEIVDKTPGQYITEVYLVHFMPTVDVRLNDRVVWDGVEYILQKPRGLRGHHIEVVAIREAFL